MGAVKTQIHRAKRLLADGMGVRELAPGAD
jgi:hypothetical protein